MDSTEAEEHVDEVERVEDGADAGTRNVETVATVNNGNTVQVPPPRTSTSAEG